MSADLIEIILLVALLALAGYAVWMHRANAVPRSEAFERGREVGYRLGYDTGHRDGRDAGRPVVVPLRCKDCGGDVTPARKAS